MSVACYEEVTRKLTTFRPSRHVKMVWRRRQQVREEVTGKLVPVKVELKAADSSSGNCWNTDSSTQIVGESEVVDEERSECLIEVENFSQLTSLDHVQVAVGQRSHAGHRLTSC